MRGQRPAISPGRNNAAQMPNSTYWHHSRVLPHAAVSRLTNRAFISCAWIATAVSSTPTRAITQARVTHFRDTHCSSSKHFSSGFLILYQMHGRMSLGRVYSPLALFLRASRFSFWSCFLCSLRISFHFIILMPPLLAIKLPLASTMQREGNPRPS